ncbi:MAG: DUF4349 domain-containing protein, partial [Geitlerinemataceae cyanobacterium]
MYQPIDLQFAKDTLEAMYPMASIMTSSHRHSNVRSLRSGFITLVSFLALASCGSQSDRFLSQEMQPQASKSAPTQSASESTADVANIAPESPAVEVPAPTPNLIQKAALTLIVESSDEVVSAVSAIVGQQQGYFIDLQDNRSDNRNGLQNVSMQIRIPQSKLDATLEKVTQLGTVKSQSRTAEDVSDQLVDLDARLRNLRKQEELLLKIMEQKSGSVAEILSVARELSTIRQSIEQISAQQKNLQTQVSYATIYLNLEAPAAIVPELKRPVTLQFKETWEDATNSVTNLTFTLLKMGIWGLSFSPYLAIVLLGIYGYRRFQKQHRQNS